MSGLSRYRKKRDPAKTTEPFSAEQSGSDSETNRLDGTFAGRFVVHQHAARRMHYDLRLQVGGVLLSFAIPQGPSLDPNIKRLAIATENHPLGYLEFEDTIPEGNYGAGSMIVWDTGGVRYNETSAEGGIERGKLDFTLSGYKLAGRFALIATGRRKAQSGLAGTSEAVAEWLLVKKTDSGAQIENDVCREQPRSVLSGMTVEELSRRDEMGRNLINRAAELGAPEKKESPSRAASPMVCTTQGAPRDGSDWLYELKLDGVRILAEKSGQGATLSYRSGRHATRNYAEVARAVRSLYVEHVVLDGEIVTFDERGRPNFALLGPRIRSSRARDLERLQQQIPVIYLVFDILELGTRESILDLRSLPLCARNQLRAQLLPGKGLLRSLDHIDGQGSILWQFVCAEELEGMVAKKKRSAYQHGPRPSPDWVKLKRAREDEFVIVGWTSQEGNSQNIGALLVGSYFQDQLRYRGRVGTGFGRSAQSQLKEALSPLAIERSPVVGAPPREEAEAHWARPELVVRVRHHGFSEDGHLQAAAFQGLRDDVRPALCHAGPSTEQIDEAAFEEAGRAAIDSSSPHPALTPERRIQLSNQDKVFWPQEGYTKGDLLAYYETIAEVILPHLRGRPVVLVRYPDGIEGKSFYQWRLPEGAPEFMRSQELYDAEKRQKRGTGKSTFLIDDVEGLLYVINLGCIPLHMLARRENSPDHCDFLTVDFDLGERTLADAVPPALDLAELLESLGLMGLPKTSGRRGLHVLVPLGPRVTFESAKLLCELLGRLIVARHPDVCTMERRKEKRNNKIYIDTGQTGHSRTIVAPYSVRAHPGATVSTPLRWDEVHRALDPSRFDILSVPDRVATLGDPMEPLLSAQPDLSRTLERLERIS